LFDLIVGAIPCGCPEPSPIQGDRKGRPESVMVRCEDPAKSEQQEFLNSIVEIAEKGNYAYPIRLFGCMFLK
jgi:hypothetical protein